MVVTPSAGGGTSAYVSLGSEFVSEWTVVVSVLPLGAGFGSVRSVLLAGSGSAGSSVGSVAASVWGVRLASWCVVRVVYCRLGRWSITVVLCLSGLR